MSLDEPNLTSTELKERMRRRLLIQHRVPTCYVVVDEDDEPIYLQWMICPADNDWIQDYFGGGFPRLEDDEVMIENAYMRTSHRGHGLMNPCLAVFVRMARELGARHLITFVGTSNGPALRGVESAGFVPYLVREDRWLLFRRSVSFRPLSDP